MRIAEEIAVYACCTQTSTKYEHMNVIECSCRPHFQAKTENARFLYANDGYDDDDGANIRFNKLIINFGIKHRSL